MKQIAGQKYSNILVPLDGSPLAECVLPHLAALTQCEIARVTLVRVVEPFHMLRGYETRIDPEEQKQIEQDAVKTAREYLGRIASQIKPDGIELKTDVLLGEPAETLVQYAQKNKVDLVLLSTHGRSGVSRWVWGSVADRVLRHVCAPVFMVRAPGCAPAV